MLIADSPIAVDVVILSRTAEPLPSLVLDGLSRQRGIDVRLHRVIGSPRETDRHRWETIARGRNEGRQLGTTPWLMFLDDDVILPAGAIRQLWTAMQGSPAYAALAADYHNASVDGRPTHHVAMGATLFRRLVLNRIPFRWEPRICECRCMCNDLRGLGWGIRYAPGIRAMHLETGAPAAFRDSAPAPSQPTTGHVLAALDRRHLDKFRRQFIGSLRRAGCRDTLSVVAYGWYPSEVARFAGMPHVRVVTRPKNHVLPPVRRLFDFQDILGSLPPDAPVAYWDAADVIFQSSLQPLWQLVRDHPERLLAVREPTGYPTNPAVFSWSQSITDAGWRQRAWKLLQQNPFLNSGFAAGTARIMLRYFQEANRMRHGLELSGSTDWGDQMALNLYCHLDASRWFEVPASWNYCAHNRPRGEVSVRPDGRVLTRSGTPIHVLHGNAHSFRKLELSNS